MFRKKSAPKTGAQASAILNCATPRAKISHAKGAEMWTTDGKRIVDFAAGIATCSFGHCHPGIVRAVSEQLAKVSHISLGLDSDVRQNAARALIDCFDKQGRVHFTNSGAEANESAFVFINSYQHLTGHPERNQIITFEGAFHGRTYATRSAAGKYTEGIGPKSTEFILMPFNNLKAVQKAISPSVAGIFVEPIQGEGGVIAADTSFLKGLRKLADKHGLLLGFDEVQTGMGRTGKLFAHEHFGVKPDVMSLAKALGGGAISVGATLMNKKVYDGLTEGGTKNFAHGTTMGGNLPAMAAVIKTVELLTGAEKSVYLGKDAATRAKILEKALLQLQKKHRKIVMEIRGTGFMRALKLSDAVSNNDVVAKFMAAGVDTRPAGDNTIRILPPLNISRALIEEGVEKLDQVLTKLRTDN